MNRHAPFALAAALALGFTLGTSHAAEDTLSGTAIARDGTTVAIGGTRIRLAGLTAPDEARCGAKSCADAARVRLAALVDGHPIACTKERRLGHGIWQGRCTLADGTDPALVLLAEGLAKAGADAPDSYRAASDAARQRAFGMFGS
jgi:endonuclease YncB( thermonuclease family)